MPFSKTGLPDMQHLNPGALLANDLFSGLRKDILQKKYAPGYKLTEQYICSEYNVSRTPVREALHRLEAEGLIETIPNRGAFVLGLDEQDFKDMFELRKAYEIQAVKWAIERINEEELDALEETFEFMEFYTQKNDIEKMLNINTTFHQIIYMASHNRILRNILSSYQIYTVLTKDNRTFADDHLEILLGEHRDIYAAFKNRDTARGISAMTIHMDNSAERFYFGLIL